MVQFVEKTFSEKAQLADVFYFYGFRKIDGRLDYKNVVSTKRALSRKNDLMIEIHNSLSRKNDLIIEIHNSC